MNPVPPSQPRPNPVPDGVRRNPVPPVPPVYRRGTGTGSHRTTKHTNPVPSHDQKRDPTQ